MHWSRFGVAAVLSTTLCAAAVAQHDHGARMMGAATNTGVKGTVVQYPSGTETVSGELFLPVGVKKKQTQPAVILIHEWWGLNDWVREQARDYAANGYVVLAVDLYHGKVATDGETAHELSRGLPHDRAQRDLVGAYTYLTHRPDVGASGKVGTIGWCFGGGLALEFGIAEPSLSAIVVNYGSLPTDAAELKKITAPVLGNFGALDKGITPADVSAFDTQMKELGKTVDLKEYPDAGHAFENENSKTGYNGPDADDAKARTKAFLAAHLS